MALSCNLAYQEIISMHPTRRQIFAGKSDSTFWNIWQWVIFQMHALAKQFGKITSQLSWLIPRGARVHIFNSNALNVLILIKWGKFWLNCKTVHNIWIREFIIWLWLKWLSRPKYWLIGRRKYRQQASFYKNATTLFGTFFQART